MALVSDELESIPPTSPQSPILNHNSNGEDEGEDEMPIIHYPAPPKRSRLQRSILPQNITSNSEE